MSSCARCSPVRRRGSSAARCATSCSAGASRTWTSSAAIRHRLRARTRSVREDSRSRSPSSTRRGASCSTAAGRSTSRRCTGRSNPTSRAATSPSTRLRCRWQAARLSTRAAAARISSCGCCVQSPRRSSRTIRCASCEARRYARVLLRAARPADRSARAIHRFRRESEPWAVEALAYLGVPELIPAVEDARARDFDEPLLRGDELGLPPGPEVGRLLEQIAEERAVGTISTRGEALDLVRRETSG